MRKSGSLPARPLIPAWHRCASTVLAAIIALMLLLPTVRSALAGDDVCPEPNDAFQVACFLGTGSEALGFVARQDDVDAYRIEVLDFGALLRAELADMPFPYRMHLADWRGQVIGESRDEDGMQVISQVLGPPGAYYLFVDSRFGQFSESAPYRVGTKVSYLGGVPNVLYSTEFRAGGAEGWFTSSNEWGRYYAEGGRYHVDMTYRGEGGDFATLAWTYWGQVEPYGDFTFIADARMTTADRDGGFFVGFRSTDELHTYALIINSTREELFVREFLGDTQRPVVPQMPLSVLNPAPEVNRIVVRSAGSEHIVNINGVEVAHFRDDALPQGRIGLGAIAVGAPVNVVFDNIVVTSPR